MVAKRIKKKGKEEEEVDYAEESPDDNDDEEESRSVENDDDEEEAEETSSDDDDDGLDDGVEAVFTGIQLAKKAKKGKKDNEEENNNNDDDDTEEGDEEDEIVSKSPLDRTSRSGQEVCSFDLRNLVAVNSHPIHTESLYPNKSNNNNQNKQKSQQQEQQPVSSYTIDTFNNNNQKTTTTTPITDEEYLLQKATEGCTQLIEALWELPVERSSDAGPLVRLPTYDRIRIPRGLPAPEPKAETKWEKFARERGIGINKEKRSRKVWDEGTGTWMYRTGYQKANAKDKEWPIMEVGGNDDPYADPWENLRDEKHARTQQNRTNQLKNQERAGLIEKGTARRTAKNRESLRQQGREGGRKDVVLPVGIPVDLRGVDSSSQPQLRGKASTLQALKASQISTASLGKFDKRIEGEPERRLPSGRTKKRKMMEEPTSKKLLSTETERGMKLLKTVLDKGGIQKEKDRRKGKLATGVTAYDYEFDDGLGPGSFRKKKGRAGSGKNKKMTKKRLKG